MSVTLDGTLGVSKVAPGVVEDSDIVQDIGARVFRNKIINGNMEIWQRGTSKSCPASTETYVADRWIVVPVGNSSTVARTAFGVAGGSMRYAMQAQGNTGITNIEVVQRIEAANSHNLAGKTITVTATLYQNSGSSWSSCTARIFRANTADTFTAITQEGTTRTFSLANGIATKFTWTFTLSANATTGIELVIDTMNAQPSATGFAVAEVQLEEGSTATPFEQRPVGLELALCQRYYEKGGFKCYGSGLTLLSGTLYFKQDKRIAPTMAYSPSPQGTGTAYATGVDYTGTSEVFFYVNGSVMNFGYTADAEL